MAQGVPLVATWAADKPEQSGALWLGGWVQILAPGCIQPQGLGCREEPAWSLLWVLDATSVEGENGNVCSPHLPSHPQGHA